MCQFLETCGFVNRSRSRTLRQNLSGAAPNAAERAVLDLGQIVDAIMVGENGILTLYNMSLVNAAPRNIPHTDTHARYKLSPFGPWPSLTILPNATVRTPRAVSLKPLLITFGRSHCLLSAIFCMAVHYFVSCCT